MRDRDDDRRGRTSAKGWTSKQTSGSIRRFKLPSDLNLAKVDSNKPRRWDFMSWIAGKGNPHFEEGERAIEFSYWCHRLGPDNEKYICPAKQLGKTCPVCEHRAKLKLDSSADEDLVKSLYPSQRQLWLIRDLDDPDAGVQLLDYSYHHFGKVLQSEINASDEDEEVDYFADMESGLTVRVAFEEEKPYGFKATSVKFKARQRQYKYADCKDLPCLEDLLIVESYDKLKAIYLQTGEDEGGDDRDDHAPDRKPKSRPAQKDEDEDEDAPPPKKAKEPEPEKEHVMTADEAGLTEGMMVRHRMLGSGCEIVRISGDGTSLTIEDANGERHKACACKDVRVEKAKKTKSEKTAPLDEDDDPPPKKKPPKEEPKPKPVEDDGWEEDVALPAKDAKADKPAEKKKTKPAQADDDDWDNDPPKNPGKAAAKPVNDDDWD